MVKANFDRVLQQLHRRAPFRLFVVELLNGDSVAVDHPEALIVRGGTAIFVTKISADADAEQLKLALDATRESADTMEKTLSGSRDEF